MDFKNKTPKLITDGSELWHFWTTTSEKINEIFLNEGSVNKFLKLEDNIHQLVYLDMNIGNIDIVMSFFDIKIDYTGIKNKNYIKYVIPKHQASLGCFLLMNELETIKIFRDIIESNWYNKLPDEAKEYFLKNRHTSPFIYDLPTVSVDYETSASQYKTIFCDNFFRKIFSQDETVIRIHFPKRLEHVKNKVSRLVRKIAYKENLSSHDYNCMYDNFHACLEYEIYSLKKYN